MSKVNCYGPVREPMQLTLESRNHARVLHSRPRDGDPVSSAETGDARLRSPR